MCRPNPGDFVRPKNPIDIRPLPGSRGVPSGKWFALTRENHGMAECQKKGDPDHFIIAFEDGAATIRAVMHHTQLKGLEA